VGPKIVLIAQLAVYQDDIFVSAMSLSCSLKGRKC